MLPRLLLQQAMDVVLVAEDMAVTKELSVIVLPVAPATETNQPMMVSEVIVPRDVAVEGEEIVEVPDLTATAEPLDAIPRNKPLMAGVPLKVKRSSKMSKQVKQSLKPRPRKL
jgi:hypothetical protein